MAGPFAILARTGINKEIRGERKERGSEKK
jgi:hypothetical protein